MTDAMRAVADERIRLATRFGEFEADSRNLVSFPSGLPGFEQCRTFVLLLPNGAAPFQCLMAVGGQPASFLTIEPRLLLPNYRCELSAPDRHRLRADDATDLLWLAMVTFDAKGSTFANLRAPVVINPTHMIGFQVVPHESLYPLRHPLALG